MEEMSQQGFIMFNSVAGVHCRVLEDNSGALTIETLPAVRPRTKYINNKYRNFSEHMKQDKLQYMQCRQKII